MQTRNLSTVITTSVFEKWDKRKKTFIGLTFMFVLLKNYVLPEREFNEHFNKLNSSNL